MTDDLLGDSMVALLTDHATPERVRRAESAGLDRALWRHLADSGFDRALAAEAHGGSALGLAEVGSLLQAAGRFAAPVPFAEAVMAHGLASAHGLALPDGVVTLAIAQGAGSTGSSSGARLERSSSGASPNVDDTSVLANAVPWGASADWVLVMPASGGSRRVRLLAVGEASVQPSAALSPCGEVDMQWPATAAGLAFDLDADTDPLVIGACLRTAQLAGAMDAVLDMTLRYAGDRSQFGRAVSKFQAVQHQLAVLAEDVFASRMAASLACDSADWRPNAAGTAAAKAVASAAAARAASIAHAVHGAMGVTAEYDLQLFTRRLHAWRGQYGSESFWAQRVGGALVSDSRRAWDFVRAPAALDAGGTR